MDGAYYKSGWVFCCARRIAEAPPPNRRRQSGSNPAVVPPSRCRPISPACELSNTVLARAAEQMKWPRPRYAESGATTQLPPDRGRLRLAAGQGSTPLTSEFSAGENSGAPGNLRTQIGQESSFHNSQMTQDGVSGSLTANESVQAS